MNSENSLDLSTFLEECDPRRESLVEGLKAVPVALVGSRLHPQLDGVEPAGRDGPHRGDDQNERGSCC